MENIVDLAQAEMAYRRAEEIASGKAASEDIDELTKYYLPRWTQHFDWRRGQSLNQGDWAAQAERLTAADDAEVAEKTILFADADQAVLCLVGRVVRIDGDRALINVVNDGHIEVDLISLIKLSDELVEGWEAREGDRFTCSAESLNLPKFDHNHLPTRKELEATEKILD